MIKLGYNLLDFNTTGDIPSIYFTLADSNCQF